MPEIIQPLGMRFLQKVLDSSYHIMVAFSQMGQRFKTVYFQDYPASSSKKKNLKLAFSERDSDIYHAISSLSSQEIRELIAHNNYTDLKSAAEKEYLPINTYCLRIFREKIPLMVSESQQPYLPGITTINPIHATFKGGHAEPLHLWYPFLEGYSPEFVESILNNFAPNADRILDPFAGTGTTPLTVARLEKTAFYCEINPLLQHLVDVKIKALTLKADKRLKLIETLKSISKKLSSTMEDMTPDAELHFTYGKIFNESKFFDDSTYEKALKSRALVDYIACSDPLTADFISVAIVSSLVPASLVKRAGDLRYKTPEELKKEKVVFEENIIKQLNRMIFDIERVEHIPVRPVLVCEDAKNLYLIPSLEIDTIITSPSYLNGTNYFRNTKIELWFLRCLNSSKDLASFREKSVTAGINDVSQRKKGKSNHPEVAKVVAQLKENAYDPRIPKMVEDYFYDMDRVFESFRYHLKKDSIIAIDIGDSIYGGVHVPTDRILTELLRDRGFNLKSEVLLRKRLSRNGSQLCQVLLIFTNTLSHKVTKEKNNYYWEKQWRDFKKGIPHQKQPFSKRNWGHPLHSLCSYQGKMKPSLAHFLVKTFVPENGIVLDPFAGVGTIPFESALNGHKAYGFEISPAARIIASAKVGRSDEKECQYLLDKLDDYIQTHDVFEDEFDNAAAVAFNKSILDYYEKNTLKEILLARRFFMENPPISASECLVTASLLHILHGNRPYALSRRSHSITPFSPSGPFEYKPLMQRLREKVQRSLDVEYPDSFVQGKVYHQDATKWWPQELENLDAIITSPPFFDSTRFHLANWLRLWFCGWNVKDFRSKPLMFVDERQKTDLSVYESIFRQARERLKKNGVVVFHLGKSKKCNMSDELSKIASKWFKVVDIFSESVKHCESHGIKDKGTVEEHQYLILSW
ncbi:MAG: DNA methyltransferase [Candidatus Edwardsbacteria bacterium]